MQLEIKLYAWHHFMYEPAICLNRGEKANFAYTEPCLAITIKQFC